MVLPAWLEKRLRCPATGATLQPETRDGYPVYVAYPEEGPQRVYDVVDGVPNFVSEQ